MKTVKFIFAAFFLAVVLNACAPNEDVNPNISPEELEKFEVKSNGGGDGTTEGPGPRPGNP